MVCRGCGVLVVRVSASGARGPRAESRHHQRFSFLRGHGHQAFSLILSSMKTCLVLPRTFLPCLPSYLLNLNTCSKYHLQSFLTCSSCTLAQLG